MKRAITAVVIFIFTSLGIAAQNTGQDMRGQNMMSMKSTMKTSRHKTATSTRYRRHHRKAVKHHRRYRYARHKMS